jgi:hypothetical protein
MRRSYPSHDRDGRATAPSTDNTYRPLTLVPPPGAAREGVEGAVDNRRGIPTFDLNSRPKPQGSLGVSQVRTRVVRTMFLELTTELSGSARKLSTYRLSKHPPCHPVAGVVVALLGFTSHGQRQRHGPPGTTVPVVCIAGGEQHMTETVMPQTALVARPSRSCASQGGERHRTKTVMPQTALVARPCRLCASQGGKQHMTETVMPQTALVARPCRSCASQGGERHMTETVMPQTALVARPCRSCASQGGRQHMTETVMPQTALVARPSRSCESDNARTPPLAGPSRNRGGVISTNATKGPRGLSKRTGADALR